MKRLMTLLSLMTLISYLTAQTPSVAFKNINYAKGKISLDNANLQLKEYSHLKILFDSVKIRFRKRFHSIYPDKTPFSEKNDGCMVIADSFMEFAGSYKFNSPNDLKRVPFGSGYMCSYIEIDTPMMQVNSAKFTDHRVVKFKLKNNEEYVFDMVISEDKPMNLKDWISEYRKYSKDSSLMYTELTLTASINKPTYHVGSSQVRRGIEGIDKVNPNNPVFFKSKSIIKYNPQQKWQQSSKKGL